MVRLPSLLVMNFNIIKLIRPKILIIQYPQNFHRLKKTRMQANYKICALFLFSILLMTACQKATISDPTREWIRFFGACAVQKDGVVEAIDLTYSPDSEHWMLASKFTSDLDLKDSLWLLITDSIGQLVQEELIDPNEVFPYAKNIQINPNGNYLLTTNSIEDIEDSDNSNAMLVEINPDGSILKTKILNDGDGESYYISDMVQDVNGNVYISGVTTAIDTNKTGWESNLSIIDQTDVYLAKLDINWNIVWDTVIGTFHGDYGITINKNDSLLWVGMSLGENNPSGSKVSMMRVNANTGLPLNIYSFDNENDVYPNHLAFLDNGGWMVLYTPINSLTETYELKLFEDDSTFYDYTLESGIEPLYVFKDRVGNYLLAGNKEGKAQFWTVEPSVGGVVIEENSYGIANSSDYRSSLSKLVLHPTQLGYLYVLGEQTRPLPNSSTDNCSNLMFMRVINPATSP